MTFSRLFVVQPTIDSFYEQFKHDKEDYWDEESAKTRKPLTNGLPFDTAKHYAATLTNFYNFGLMGVMGINK